MLGLVLRSSCRLPACRTTLPVGFTGQSTLSCAWHLPLMIAPEASPTVHCLREAPPKHISLDELRRHTNRSSCWVVYGGNVYDVTSFLTQHPGGMDAVLFAAGQDLETFWAQYTVHYRKNVLATHLEQYFIGTLSPEDAEELRHQTESRDRTAVARAKS